VFKAFINTKTNFSLKNNEHMQKMAWKKIQGIGWTKTIDPLILLA
jgi:hypothetical protein